MQNMGCKTDPLQGLMNSGKMKTNIIVKNLLMLFWWHFDDAFYVLSTLDVPLLCSPEKWGKQKREKKWK